MNRIYEGDGLVLIRAKQEQIGLTLEGWEDLSKPANYEIDDTQDDLLFSIVEKDEGHEMRGHGANGYYNRGFGGGDFLFTYLILSSMTPYRGGYYGTPPSYARTTVANDRTRYRNSSRYRGQVGRNSRYFKSAPAKYGASRYAAAGRSRSTARQGYMSRQQSTGAFKSSGTGVRSSWRSSGRGGVRGGGRGGFRGRRRRHDHHRVAPGLTPAVRYAKRLGGAPIEYRRVDLNSTRAQSFELWVTLGGMALDDALRLSLPREYAEETAGHLFEILFPVDDPAQQARPELDLETNPDAREMYDALAVMFREWRGRRCSLRFFQNYGPELTPSEPVAELLRTRDSAAEMVFDVVIEHRYSPLEYAVEKGYGASKTDLLEWLRETVFLFLAWGDHSVDRLPSGAPESLRVAGLIERSDEDAWEISEAGQEHAGALLAEAESYARDFGVFH